MKASLLGRGATLMLCLLLEIITASAYWVHSREASETSKKLHTGEKRTKRRISLTGDTLPLT